MWVARAIPFWLGAAGVLVMDAIVGGQFLIYGEGVGRVEVLVDDYDDDGSGGGRGRRRGRWTTVSGWMRGWVPSPRISPGRIATEVDVDGRGEDEEDLLDEEGRPLLPARRRRDDGHDEHERNGYGGVSM